MDTNHGNIYHPADESLISRAAALRETIRAYRNLRASEAMSGNADWEKRLGEAQEMGDARKTVFNSIRKAQEGLSKAELDEAVEYHMISKEEVSEFISAVRLAEMQASRKSQNSQKSHSHNQ